MNATNRQREDLLALPIFDAVHRQLAVTTDAWAQGTLRHGEPEDSRESIDRRCRDLVGAQGTAGLIRYCVPREYGGALADFDARAICLIRDTLAYHDGLADFVFAMQGLGSGAISLAGSPELKARYLPRVARGEFIAAFALSEPEAGSDVAAMTCRAGRLGEGYMLEGTKTWISNGGIADFYCVFARTVEGGRRPDGTMGASGISAFVVEPSDPGFKVARRIDVNAPHPLAQLEFDRCRIPANRLLGNEGDGFKIAMRTLDVFRSSVAAAATGLARRALAEGLAFASSRRMFGRFLTDFQLTQAALADMSTAIEAASLLTYRAAWNRDVGRAGTLAAAMAKMNATEAAQQVIDRALQMFGGRGVEIGSIIEKLYREIRSLRIYEGATEVQKMIIAREVLR